MSLCEKLIQHLKNGTIYNICRVCFMDLDKGQNLSHNNEQKYLTNCFYAELTSLSMNPNSDPIMNFCTECILEIENCHKFRKKCIDAAIILRDVSEKIIKHEKSDSNIVEIDRSQNNLGTILDNGQEVIKKDLKDECQVFDVEFLDESILEPYDSDHLAVSTHKKYSRSKKTIANKPKRVQPKVEQQVIVDKATIIQEKERSKKTANKPKRIQPKVEQQVIVDKATIIQDNESNNETKSVICLICNKSYTNEKDLNIHMSLHDQNLHCNTCNKEFKDRTKLRRHIMRHMSVKPHKCNYCDKTFCEINDLKKHTRVHTGDIVGKKKCKNCKTTFSCYGEVSRHVCAGSSDIAGRSQQRWTCWCGRALSSRRLLRSHQRVHDNHKPHACLHCHKRFRHDSTLITHLRTHSGEKPYMCSVCGKTFIQSTNLSLHMRTHTGEKPYSCKKCPMKFASGSSLKTHTLSHNEAKQTCKICGKTLAPASMLGHIRLHASGKESRGVMRAVRRHNCSLCDKTFVTAAVLREHMLVHTGEKPFECKFCPKKFPTKQRLERHNKVKHNKLTKNVGSGTNEKISNEQILDLSGSDDKSEIDHHDPSVSNELVLKPDGETKRDVIKSARS